VVPVIKLSAYDAGGHVVERTGASGERTAAGGAIGSRGWEEFECSKVEGHSDFEGVVLSGPWSQQTERRPAFCQASRASLETENIVEIPGRWRPRSDSISALAGGSLPRRRGPRVRVIEFRPTILEVAPQSDGSDGGMSFQWSRSAVTWASTWVGGVLAWRDWG